VTTLAEVIEGLASQLASIPTLTVYDHVPGHCNFPAAIIVPPTIPDYRDDLDDGSYTALFEVPVLVGSAIAENQRTLVPFLDPRSPTSIFQAVEGDRTLGGLNVDALVSGSPRRLTFDEVAAYKAWGQMVAIVVSIS